MFYRALSCLAMLMLLTTPFAQEGFVQGDARPDAPELAPRGDYPVGVRTVTVTNPDQLDIMSYSAENTDPRYDRELVLEVWYPASLPEGRAQRTVYTNLLRNQPADAPARTTTFIGRAVRDAEADSAAGPFPLVIVSHGYPGTRLMMTNITENLASKGYVVVAIDHLESTYADSSGRFPATLLNRALDQLFVLESMAELNEDDDSFLAGMVDADNTAILGYSMGGFGALNAAGAGFAQAGVDLSWGVPGGQLAIRQAGNPDFEATHDERIRAVVAIAPWGRQNDFWDAEGMAGLTVPVLFIVGDHDDVSQYETGVRLLFEEAVNAERYMLVYQNARHNVVPNPAPTGVEGFSEFMHYAEPAWDSVRINNINQHFITAFLGMHLQGEDYSEFLELEPTIAIEGVWAMEDGAPTEAHTYWPGFQNRTAIGLEFYRGSPQD